MINLVSVRWDFDEGYVKDSNLVTLLLMWAHCSYVLECIMLFLLCVSGFLRRMAFRVCCS